MPVTHIADVAAISGATSSPIDTTGATLLIAISCVYSGEGTPSDSKGNPWTRIPSGAFFPHVSISYCAAPTVGPGHTFGSPGAYGRFSISAWSGLAASPLDQEASAYLAAGGAIPSLTAPTLTPSAAGCLAVVGGVVDGGGLADLSVDSGFSVLHQHQYDGATEGVLMGFKILTSADPVAPTISWLSGGAAAGVQQALFLPAGSVAESYLVGFGRRRNGLA